MRNLFFVFTLAVCLGGFISCTNEEQETNVEKQVDIHSDIEVVNGGTMIRFKDQGAYGNALLRISAMTVEERFDYLDSLSFKPQVMIMQEADDELENICNQAADYASFNALYEKYKQKHGKMFMFNDSDASDLSPYSRLYIPTDEYFVNSNGQFMIGDSLVESKMYNSFSERNQQFLSSMTREISSLTSINDAFSRQSKRKVGMQLSIGSGLQPLIHVQFTSQKKNLFGWVRYDTVYNTNVNLRGGGFEFAQGELLDFGPVYVNKDGIPFGFSTKELSGNVSRIFGRKMTGTQITGTIEIWSRGVPYEQRGFSSVRL